MEEKPKEIVAKMEVPAEGGNPVWKCALCPVEVSFLSVMIAHQFVNHGTLSLTQDGVKGILIGHPQRPQKEAEK